ncbi:hypothetical protein MtrunA17_Chr8g0344671 [Medicago truncatula]|uniref:Uncharacterized protein n=1 Tax=Medicago truncatula TaxID=3880 RepID=A0A396GDM0_MEDTR|nr:hypothetical protein MtrunA17_Chr8g0344671 [Medicago truncatula]
MTLVPSPPGGNSPKYCHHIIINRSSYSKETETYEIYNSHINMPNFRSLPHCHAHQQISSASSIRKIYRVQSIEIFGYTVYVGVK